MCKIKSIKINKPWCKDVVFSQLDYRIFGFRGFRIALFLIKFYKTERYEIGVRQLIVQLCLN